jgi:hypothetical protein
MHLLSRVCGAIFLLGLLVCLGVAAAGAEEPALPSGLSDSGDTQENSTEPSLPSGLSGSDQGSDPELPKGLATESEQKSKDEAKPELSRGLWAERFRLPLYGFFEARLGPRLHSDPVQSEDITVGEARLQLETEKYWPSLKTQLDATTDVLADGVAEEADLDLRRLRLTWTPLPSVDIRAGRQVLSWGTGDQLFINDLFPKDWQSFLIGRDIEYLKAPGNAVRLGWFNALLNLNLVYTPRFDPDRFISGERLSYYNPQLGRIAGAENELNVQEPDDWFEDDEWAARIYRTVGSFTVAAYGYTGYWKSPGGTDPVSGKSLFPELNVVGASLQGPIGPGIANIEAGYYDSEEDRDGTDPFIKNSELRFLIGYEQELAHELTGSVQYYLEHMQDYDEYRQALPRGMRPRDEDRQLLTLRLTKLLLNQDLRLSLFVFYSPTDQDAYLRPRASYELTDSWTVEAGGNIFRGQHEQTFFGQFEDNSNVYAAVRYSFTAW